MHLLGRFLAGSLTQAEHGAFAFIVLIFQVLDALSSGALGISLFLSKFCVTFESRSGKKDDNEDLVFNK